MLIRPGHMLTWSPEKASPPRQQEGHGQALPRAMDREWGRVDILEENHSMSPRGVEAEQAQANR